MKPSQLFHIEAAHQPDFLAAGLASFDSLMHDDVGESLSRVASGRELRRMTITTSRGIEVYYLKRLGREPLTMALRMVLLGQRPHSGPLRELALLSRLRASGFDAMKPVAWGERRFGLFSFSGFLVVQAVVGEDVAGLFMRLSGPERRLLMRSVGHLIGRLHAAGYYQPVRLKDLIAEAGHQLPWSKLVLIDRETSKPWAARFSRHRCLTSLARAARRTLRDGHRPGAGSACGFLRGYADGVAHRWQVAPVDLVRSTLKAVRKELSATT